MLTVTSKDGGASWSNPKWITPRGTSVGVGIYDSIRDRIVFQYQTFKNKNPYQDTEYFQMTSPDDALTWSDPVSISSYLAPCNVDPSNKVRHAQIAEKPHAFICV
jgi:hypothetical protein